MEATVQKAEAQWSALQKESELPHVASNSVKLLEIMAEMEKLKAEIDRLYQRWAELERVTS